MGAIRRGRAQADLLGQRAPVTGLAPADSMSDARSVLEDAERRFAADASLWVREWAATATRGALKTAAEAGDAELAARAEDLATRLHAVDEAEIGPIRARLAAGELGPEGFRAELLARPEHERDAFVRRLLDVDRVPERRTERTEGMVHYVATPLDVVLEVADLIRPEDVVYDIGSGLGYVTMLLAWLTPARVIGVEFEPAYHERAAALAAQLGFTRLRCVQADARDLEYADGTAFYIYDAIRGELLDAVLARLEQVALRRRIRVISRGFSNFSLEEVPWLEVLQDGPRDLMVLASTQTE